MPEKDEMDDIDVLEFCKRLEAAAVRFAAGHGPLAAAMNGDENARAEVGNILLDALNKNGLTVKPI